MNHINVNRSKYFYPIIGVLALAGITCGIWFLMNTPKIIKSDDGLLSISIPKSALPDDVNAEDIKATLIPIPSGSNGLAKVYKLEPDGAEFTNPIHVKYLIPKAEAGKMLAAYNVNLNTNKIDEIANSLFRINSDGSGELTGDISHFSSLFIYEDFFAYKVTGGGIHNVGDPPFNVDVEVDNYSNEKHHSVSNEQSIKISLKQPWWIWGVFSSSDGILDPAGYTHSPDRTQVDGKNFKISKQFSCKKEGLGFVHYDLYIETDRIRSSYGKTVSSGLIALLIPDKEYKNVNHYYIGSDIIRCKTNPAQIVNETAQQMPQRGGERENVKKLPTPSIENKSDKKSIQKTEPKSVIADGKTYYMVSSDNPDGNSGDKVCQSIGKKCVGYTALNTAVCKSFHPDANEVSDFNGSKAGFYCNGAPQGGVCAEEKNTCHICPACNINMDCSGTIGDLYRETYVECEWFRI